MKKAIFLAILAAAPAVGQMTQKYYDWYDSPVKFLMTADENRQFHALKSDAEAEKFIALFWAKRDPTPGTERNEFQEEFDRRVAFADKNFTDTLGRGALSDRGKAFILLGPPYRVSGSGGAQINGMGIAANANRFGVGPAASGQTADPDTQYWMYAHENKPKFIKQGDFTITFTRQDREWLTATTERTNPNQVFMAAVDGYIVSPNLTAAPSYAKALVYNTTFRSADVKSAFENFKADTAPVTWGEFVTSEGDHFVSSHLSLPADAAGKQITSWAVVEDPSGKIVDVRERETMAASSGTDAYVDESLQLAPGTYNVTFGASAQANAIAEARSEVKVEGLDPKAPAVSPLILASAVIPMKTNWSAMDPFVFGGFRVIPKADATFGTSGDLWYFVELRNPGVTDEGKPNIRVRVDVRGTTPKGPVKLQLPEKDASLAPLRDEENRYALGTALPLEGFRPGDYTMKVHIVDVVLGKEYDLEKPFHIRG
ncbi:MAG TPA: GWxTD domain-containing protein [Vicinamibacterales bacterium]|nr:GWxTD domain-containing protein [Vicinamibacterales bacterium]